MLSRKNLHLKKITITLKSNIYTANILKIFEIIKFFMLNYVNENKINFSALSY